MNNPVIIGCPYTSMKNLEKAFAKIGISNLEVINCDQVAALDFTTVYLCNNREYAIEDFSCSFIRFPYDLIPPHSGSFELREETEFFKSIALQFDSISINSLASTWMLRNRAFSLSKAQKHGVNVAEYNLVKNFDYISIEKDILIKAIGNCYFSENSETISQEIEHLFRVEEDNGDFAVTFPASCLDSSNLRLYMDYIGCSFIQKYVKAREFRGYIIGDTPFIYVREEIETVDKSAAKLLHTDFICSSELLESLKNLMKSFNLGYLCFDFLVEENNVETVIDINPYGSMPRFEEHPAPSIKLADIIVDAK